MKLVVKRSAISHIVPSKDCSIPVRCKCPIAVDDRLRFDPYRIARGRVDDNRRDEIDDSFH